MYVQPCHCRSGSTVSQSILEPSRLVCWLTLLLFIYGTIVLLRRVCWRHVCAPVSSVCVCGCMKSDKCMLFLACCMGQTWCMSLGKYLELMFNAKSFIAAGNVCPHSIRSHTRYFGKVAITLCSRCVCLLSCVSCSVAHSCYSIAEKVWTGQHNAESLF